MRISYDLQESDKSGKHKFFMRLRACLVERGYQEVANGQPADVHLFADKPSENAKHGIYRLDGVWVNTEMKDWAARNEKIRKKMKAAKGIIYQNQFCREATETLCNYKHANSTNIFNGADPSEFKVEPYRHDKPYFLAMCKWRPHKRLKPTVKGFLQAGLKDVDLLILGEADYVIEHPQIKYLGWQGKETINAYLAGCVATTHLCWLDWCPNSVVESVVAGKQVIYSSSGGTPLIVGDRGYRVQDAPWAYTPHAMYKPPALDIGGVAKAFVDAYERPKVGFDASDLDIAKIAEQYDAFIRQTVGK
jgi:glycosyltransferase involved in cell wall biosynthesis